jgi:hypothetical protein
MPSPGFHELRLLTPQTLELTLVTGKKPDPARLEQWDFIDAKGEPHLPAAKQFEVSVGSMAGKEASRTTSTIEVAGIGFKRRVLYAPLKQHDLRVANELYLRLAGPVSEDQPIEVRNPDGKLWPPSMQFRVEPATNRWSPAIHVNQTGYIAGYPKKAMIGYYLGSQGELALDGADGRHFSLLDAAGKAVFSGTLTPRLDRGFPSPAYQDVLEADFSAFKIPGEYRLFVPGLGVSYPFFVDDGIAAAFARTYALGLYHQRCGTSNALPFTRFIHGPCHTAPAEVPDTSARYKSANESLAKESANFKENPRHTARQLKDVSSSLYPFVTKGTVEVSGGHHDAGDYSKYTINSAAFIHHLVFAADLFPGVHDLDNLGIPESGDGKSDVLQEAKWEADFLAKMQDADGGFYFLVYPREREYETDVLPDHGDPQIVFPKTTAATAAATAALAQCASSPTFKKQFPEAAALYLEKARKGWSFLEKAIAKFGKDGAYQKITHYGDEFMHDDELAWAACELYLATSEKPFHDKVIEWLHPADPEIRKWGWLRLYESYGNAIRSYAFAEKCGKLKRNQLDQSLVEQCQAEIEATGQDQLHRAEASAYGTSFPEETKRVSTAGWYFSCDAAFDLATAYQLDYPIRNDPRPKLLDALLTNLNYEEGCNPVNVAYLTGLGWHRQREIVHQYAQNDRRILPPTGIPLGNIQAGIGWNFVYQKEAGVLSFPPDSDAADVYPFYDRWSDAFNLSQEFVILNQARALACLSWLMAQSPVKSQPWKPVAAAVTRRPGSATFILSAPSLDLSNARVIWEAGGQEPLSAPELSLNPARLGQQWLEAEAQLPDGRRLFAITNAASVK